MKKRMLIVTTIIIVMLNNGCNQTKQMTTPVPPTSPPIKIIDITVGTSEKLYMHRWALTNLNNKMIKSKAFLAFTPGQVNSLSGNTGCNNLKGSYTLTSFNTIKISPIATTKMACLLDDNTESEFLKAIAETDTWSATDKDLSFYKGTVLLAKFNAMTTQENSTGLQGNWELNYISGKRIAFEGLYPNKKPQVTFNLVTSEIMGNTSCNNFTSTYTLNAGSITIADPKKMTKMACQGEGENAFLDMMKKINRHSVSANTLNLLIGDVAVMRFEKK